MPLLYVLWTISLLTIIAVASQSSGTLSYRLVRNTADAAQYEAFAEAVLNRAVLSLLDEHASDRLPVDGSAETFTFNDIAVTARIQDEQGRIDIEQIRHHGAKCDQVGIAQWLWIDTTIETIRQLTDPGLRLQLG